MKIKIACQDGDQLKKNDTKLSAKFHCAAISVFLGIFRLIGIWISVEILGTVNPIRPRLFSHSRGPGGGGGGGLIDLDAKNQGYHQLIEMKLCMSHFSHKSMPDAKFESGSLSIFGDTMSQIFPLKKGMSHQIRISTPGKWV